jgi:hypothetical protein
MDRSRPALVPGTRYEFSIHFTGDATLFNMRAATFSVNPPRELVKGNYIVFRYERTDHNVEALKVEYERDLSAVKTALGWVRSDVELFNTSLNLITAQRRTIVDPCLWLCGTPPAQVCLKRLPLLALLIPASDAQYFNCSHCSFVAISSRRTRDSNVPSSMLGFKVMLSKAIPCRMVSHSSPPSTWLMKHRSR